MTLERQVSNYLGDILSMGGSGTYRAGRYTFAAIVANFKLGCDSGFSK